MTLSPGDVERLLTQRLAAYQPMSRKARRRLGSAGGARVRFGVVAAMTALMLAFVGGAFAVHDEGFQLEGNVQAEDLSYVDIDPGGGGGTLRDGTLAGDFAGAFDWDSLFAADTSEIDQTANGFTDQDFVVDYRIKNNAFDPSDATAFTGGGSNDGLPISSWRCKEESNVTDKGDIINAYAAIREEGGKRVLYFGIEKQQGNGDNNVGLWLFQGGGVGCEWNGAGNGTPFHGAHVPGDLLLVAENTNGGGIASIVAYEWVADVDGNAANGLQPGLNEDDPVAEGADCLDDLAGGDDICATTNGKNISVPWPHAGAVGAVSGLGGQYEKVSFIEGEINLTAFDEFKDTCFTGFLFNTRSSQELTATLYDYAMGDIDTCRPDLSLDKEPETQTHNVGDSFDWTLTVDNTGDGDADDALVSDTIPDGLTINSATVDPETAGSCVIDEQDVDCTIDVPVGGSVDIVINVTSTLDVFGESTDGCVTVTNTGTVSDDEDESVGNDTDSATATICRPLVSKTAEGSYTETHTWSVTKSVDPTHADANAGQAETFDYDVVVDETVTDSDFAVSGTITITNPNPEDDMTVDVTDALGSGETAAATDIDCGAAGDGDDLAVPAGDSVECTYAIDTGDATAGTNTATATLNSIDFDATAGYTFSPTVVGPTEVDVEDTFDNGTTESKGTVDGDDTIEYSRDVTCPTDASLYDENGNLELVKGNTVEIKDGDTVLDSDTASITLDCWLPIPDKTASGSFDRSWSWDIDKQANDTEITLGDGQSTTVSYDVTVSATSSDTNFAVSGWITIENPNPEDDMTVDVTDELSSGESAAATDIDCGAAGDGDDAVVPAGDSITCTYDIDTTNGDTGTNTATVTLEAGDTDPEVEATADYTFALDEEIDECIDVTDTYAGDLGPVCASDLPKTFEYDRTVGPFGACGDFEVDNTADFVTNDTGATGEASETVVVHVTGCGNLFHTGTTCAQYLGSEPPSGLAGTGIDTVQYSVKGNKISQANPGVFFYYTTVTATGTSASVVINQTPPAAYSHPFGIQNSNQVRVYDANCTTYSNFTFSSSGGDVTLTINGMTAGSDYIISVKYDTGTIVGGPKPSTSPVTYSWQTEFGGNVTGVDSLDLVRKK